MPKGAWWWPFGTKSGDVPTEAFAPSAASGTVSELTQAKTPASPKPERVMTPEEEVSAGMASGGFKRLLMDAWKDEWTRSGNAILGLIYDRNPDDLVASKAMRVKVYQDMLRDPYIKAGLSIKKLSVVRLPNEILPATDSEEDKKISEFVADQLECMETPWFDLLWNILNAVDVGYSIAEMNYKVVEKGKWQGKIGLSTVKGKDPYFFSFRINQRGDIATVIQRVGNIWAPNSMLPHHEFPPEKFLVASFQQLYNNPYGSSDLRAAYRAFFIKDWAWKFRSIFMEKWGMPTVMGQYPPGMSEERRQQLEGVLDSIQNDTVVTIPADIKIELLRVATTANQQEYERAIQDLNKEILVGLIGSFLGVDEGHKTGSRASGQVHMQVSKLFIESLVTTIQEVVNRQLIRRLVDMNFDVEKYPKLHFDMTHMNADEIMSEIGVDAALAAMGIIVDPKYLYRKYDRPMPDMEYVPIDPAANNQNPQSKKPKGASGGAPAGPAGPQLYIRRISANPDVGVTPPPKPGDSQAADQKASKERKKEATKVKMAETLECQRAKALPEQPQKIGALREAYSWILRLAEGFDDDKSKRLAFDLAGREREFRIKTGHWMSFDEAQELYAQAVAATERETPPPSPSAPAPAPSPVHVHLHQEGTTVNNQAQDLSKLTEAIEAVGKKKPDTIVVSPTPVQVAAPRVVVHNEIPAQEKPTVTLHVDPTPIVISPTPITIKNENAINLPPPKAKTIELKLDKDGNPTGGTITPKE